MSLITIVLAIIVVGVLLWLVETYIPMSPPIRMVLRAVVVIVIILWLLSVFGLLDSMRAIYVPRVR